MTITQNSQKKTVWHLGPPPSLGWWPASVTRNSDVYRWWNGECWSLFALKAYPIEVVGEIAMEPLDDRDQRLVRWTNRPKSWPARSKT